MLSWLSGKTHSVGELIAQKKYDEALELIDVQLKEQPRNVHLRLQMGDVLAMVNRGEAAVKILLGLVDEFAADGFVPKAIAVLKKIQRIEPDRTDIAEKLATLIQRKGGTAFRTREGLWPQPRPPEDSSTPEVTKCQTEGRSPPEEAPLASPLVSDFSREELLAVIGGLSLRTFEPGEIIMTEGEQGKSLFILTTGVVRAYVKNADGRNVQVRIMGEGEFFGEISLLTGKPRTATLTASTSCELLELDKAVLVQIAREHPHVVEVVKEFHDKRAGSHDEEVARSTREDLELF